MRKRFITCALLFSYMLSCASYATEIVQSPQITEQPTENSQKVYAKSVTKKANVSNMEIYLNGERVKPSAYLISVNEYGAYTYFKLRDLAYLMMNTECQFSVDYDEKNKKIIATTGEKYIPNGSEMKISNDKSQTAYETNSPIWLNGKKIEMESYRINGNTYYKLRDLGDAFGFQVGYKDASRQAIMRTPSYEGPDVNGQDETTTPSKDPEGGITTKPNNSQNNQSNQDNVQDTNTPPQDNTQNSNTNNETNSGNTSQNPDEVQKPDDIINPNPDPELPPPIDPTKKIDGRLTVLIDVGHGGSDGGAGGKAPYEFITYTGKTIPAGGYICERDFNLPVALMLRDMLEEKGAEVIMSAQTDKYVSFAERKSLIESNAEKADILVSIHHNAFNEKTAGFEILAQIKYKNGGAGFEFAKILEKHYFENGRIRRVPTVFREGSKGDYYAILRYAAGVEMLAVMSEYAYLDHAEDVKSILSNDGLKKEAQAICNAIIEYFETTEY